VKKIYVLIRPKKGLEIKYRLQELMSSKLFENLKKTKPDVMTRVEAIPGDITKPGFAISEDDQRYKDRDKSLCFKLPNSRKLTEEVSIVFHSAATVRFDEDLTKSVDLNVVAVFTIMDICRKMKNLEVKFPIHL
jgi:fatty acyl-CoA reductase